MKIIFMLLIWLTKFSYAADADVFANMRKEVNFCLHKNNYIAEEEAIDQLFDKKQVLVEGKVDAQKILASIENFLASQINVAYFYLGDALPKPMCMVGLPAPSKDNCNWVLNRRTALYKLWHKNKRSIITSLSHSDNYHDEKSCLRLPMFKDNNLLTVVAEEKINPDDYGEYYIFFLRGKEYLLSAKIKEIWKTELTITENQQLIKDLKNKITSIKYN